MVNNKRLRSDFGVLFSKERGIQDIKLRGITQKLDYIKELGVDTIYMTPIFKAGSSDKYDTHDIIS